MSTTIRKFKTVITKTGAAKLAQAAAPDGKPVRLTHMAVGDGGGTLPTPDSKQTCLVHEVWRHTINRVTLDTPHPNRIIAELVIPPETGGFWIREIGVFDEHGDLIAVGNTAESYKPTVAEGSGRAQTFRTILTVSSAATVELTVDNTMVMATVDYVDDKLKEHERSRNHPDATLDEKGFTQLSSETDSSSEDKSATPKAVKAVMDETQKKAPLDSPALTGNPTAPTPDLSATGLEIANAAFVAAKVAQLVDSSPEAMDTLKELADALGNDPNFATTMLNALAGKQPLDATLTNLSGKDVLGLLQYLGLVETINKAAGAVQRGGDTMTGDLNLPNLYASGIIKSGGEIQTTSANAYRIIYGDYGVFWHQNGNDLYLMLTNRGDPYGAFNDLRPFVVNLTTGKVSITNGATIHGLRVESSIALGTDNALGANAIVLGDSDTGFKQNGDGILDAYSNGRQVMRITPNAVQVFSWTGSWISMRDQPCFTNHAPVITDGAEAIARQEHQDRHFILGGLGNHQFGIYMINKSRSVNGTDGQAFLDENGNWICGGQVVPGNYANFDARYATQAWVLQNFVQNIDLTAPTEFQFWDGRGYMRPTDGAAMYNFAMVGGSSNVGWIQIRYTRKLVNNTWYVIN